jgi:hypothetical protein
MDIEEFSLWVEWMNIKAKKSGAMGKSERKHFK